MVSVFECSDYGTDDEKRVEGKTLREVGCADGDYLSKLFASSLTSLLLRQVNIPAANRLTPSSLMQAAARCRRKASRQTLRLGANEGSVFAR
jgi:hypothetical protein